MTTTFFTYNYPIQPPYLQGIPLSVQTSEKIENLTLVGSGAYGAVYLKRLQNSYHAKPVARDLAIKIIKFSSSLHRKFAADEVRVLQKIGNKPNLVVYLDSFQHHDYISITTEYIPGQTLTKAYLESVSYTSLPRIFYIGRQVASALGTLRELNVVHGDLKPDNIIVNGDIVKLIDFGIAIDLEKKTCNDHTLYPIQFRPPEIILNTFFNDNSPDTWALAMTLIAIFTKKFMITSNHSMGIYSQFNTLLAINTLIGPPPLDFVQRSRDSDFYFQTNKTELIRADPIGTPNIPLHPNKFDLIDIVASRITYDSPNDVAFFHSLLQKMLKWDPNTRISPHKICEEIDQFISQKTK